MNKYNQKEAQIIKEGKRKKLEIKVKALGIGAGTIGVFLILMAIFKEQSLWLFIAMICIVPVELRFFERKLDGINAYMNQKINLLERLKTEDEMEHWDDTV